MSNLSTNLFEAVDSLITRRIDSTAIDLTITGRVALQKNIETGEYKVTYKGDTFSAYSLDPLTVYKLNEEVYVLVPGGDFSAKKIILGKAAFNSKISHADRQAMQNQWRPRGPNWLSREMYYRKANGTFREVGDTARGEITVVSSSDINSMASGAYYQDFIFKRDDSLINLTQQKYDKSNIRQDYNMSTTDNGRKTLKRIDDEVALWGTQLEHIIIKANFETKFLNTHYSGDYGLLVGLLTLNPRYDKAGYENEPEYLKSLLKVSISNFNGNPYSLSQPTPQQAVFQVPKGTVKGLYYVALYQDDGWQTDIEPASLNEANNPDPNGTRYTFEVPPAKKVLNRNNISATNVEIYWAEPINLKERLYWIKIEAPKGTSLYNTRINEENNSTWVTEVPLRARLMYGAEDITNEQNCKFVWFRQKASGLRDYAKGTTPDNYGNTWAAYLPEGENGWAPITEMVKPPVQSFHFGYEAKYKLGVLSKQGDFKETKDYSDTLLIPISEVKWKWQYLCVCYYNPDGGTLQELQRNKQNDVLVWAKEEVTNLSSIHDFELPAPYIGEDLEQIFLRVRDNNLPWEIDKPFRPADPSYPDWHKDWYCRWWVKDGEAYYALEDIVNTPFKRFHRGRRRIDDLLLNKPLTFIAQIYGRQIQDNDGRPNIEKIAFASNIWVWPPQPNFPDMTQEYNEYEIANIERTITPKNDTKVHVEFFGQRAHYYNADGKIRLAESADKQYNIRAKITLLDESLTTFSVEWLAPDRTPLVGMTADQQKLGAGYTPANFNTMLKDMWMSSPTTGNEARMLHYRIVDTYDIDKAGELQNTFYLRIQFLNGAVEEIPCTISYIKADSNGSQGSEWTAQIWPCNATPALDQGNAVGFTPWTKQIQDHPRFLFVRGPLKNPTSGPLPVPDNDYRVFLRPFIRRNGEALESLNEANRYTYKVFWDARLPEYKGCTSNPRTAVSNGSFLRFSHTGISNRPLSDLGRDGSLVNGTPIQRGKTVPENALDLQAYTHSLDTEGSPYNGTSVSGNRTYGAIEVKWHSHLVNGQTYDKVGYPFIIKARIEIFYDNKGIASIESFYPVDVIFAHDSYHISQRLKPHWMKTNWPREVLYNSNGMSPVLSNESLYFYYGKPEYLATAKPPRPYSAVPVNLTPDVQVINEPFKTDKYKGRFSSHSLYSVGDIVIHEGKVFEALRNTDPHGNRIPPDTPEDFVGKYWKKINRERTWKLLPKNFYFFEDMGNGALATEILKDDAVWPTWTSGVNKNPDFKDWGNAVFVRPIVYRISQYGNDAINGWDGRSISLNDSDGTLFAPTVGAGWKHPFTNTFSGVVMGIDKSQRKQSYEAGIGGFSEDNKSRNPYMTGLYGYQDGVNSFGIMENGTAFFGRADRGGRIIIDGYNAQIYGGIVTEKDSGINADMRNRMRLSFIDFGALGSSINLEDSALKAKGEQFNQYAEQLQNYRKTVDWKRYNCEESYRKTVDERIKKYKDDIKNLKTVSTPGLEMGKNPAIVLGSFSLDKNVDLGGAPAKDRWFGNFEAYFAPGRGTLVNTAAAKFAGYYSGASFSTPAIEIGSYKDWMMDENGRRKLYTTEEKKFLDPTDTYQYHRGSDLIRKYTIDHIRQQGIYNNINSLEIPGFRKFLVTYDGTLYAMNAFIKGNIISSNIVGSQFFNAEGTFAVTENGNLGIGKGAADWSKDEVDKGYSEKWSNQVPVTSPKKVVDYLTGKGAKTDFAGGGGFAFFVDNTGTVICKDIHVGGGSIDIGDFHVIGKEKADNSNGRYGVGDVVSFGTMFLIGSRANSGHPALGKSALEVWGDIHARGRLANLGPVFLGGSWEKRRNAESSIGPHPRQSQYPTSFNSPLSITPTMSSAGSVSPDSRFPVRGAFWPLYFYVTKAPSSSTENTSWVTLSGPDTANGLENKYMPAFSKRSEIVFFKHGNIAQEAFWRVDRLGMWSDSLFFTHRDWVGNRITDDTPLSFSAHGLAQFGWHVLPGATVSSGLGIINLARAAQNLFFETPAVIRLSATGDSSTLRGTNRPGTPAPPAPEENAKIILQTRKRRGTIGPSLFLQGTGTSATSIGVMDAPALFFSTQTVAGTGSLGSLNAFLSLNAIKFGTGREWKDDTGEVIARTPEMGDKQGIIWMKAVGVAVDSALGPGTHPGAVADATNNYVSTLRLNRSWDGTTSGQGMPNGEGDSAGVNFAGLSGGTVMIRSRKNFSGYDSIHIVNDGADNSAGNNEIFMSGQNGIVRVTGRKEITLGINSPGHSVPTVGLKMITGRFELLGFTAEQQFGIYARFG